MFKVVILCAGQSKRLKPVSDKTVLSFYGKSALAHKLNAFVKFGASEFLIVVGSHNKIEVQTDLENTKFNYQIVEQEILEEGMAGAVKAVAKAQVNDLDKPILIVSNNDTVSLDLIKKIVQQITKNPKNSFVVGKKVEQYFPGGYIEVNQAGNLIKIIEKPEITEVPSDMINLVYHYYSTPQQLYLSIKKHLENKQKLKDDIYEQALQALIKAGYKIQVLPYNGFWIPIKNPTHILQTAYTYSKSFISKKAKIHPSAILEGEVYIDDEVKVDAHAVIVGPTYIGKNSIVGVGTLIRGSHIGANCVIGFNSEIARSYIGSNSWFHRNFIGDSIIGNNVSFGAGAITGNLRLDEKEIDFNAKKLGVITGDNIRIGINTNFMPGTKIGSNSIIAPALTVNQNIPDNSYVKNTAMNSMLEVVSNSKDIPIR